jgi:GNAT superfamily N-acetyltransferase
VRENAGALAAGISGYTWGGCCYITYLWVSESSRRNGLGSELLDAVELHAREKRCRLVLLSSHSFHAPQFYARRGYQPVAHIDDHPVGHASIFHAKRLGRG